MTQDSPVNVAELRCAIDSLSNSFNDEAYRIVTRVAVAAAKVKAITAHRSGDEAPLDLNPVRASVAATERVSVSLQGIAASAGDLRAAMDAIVGEMMAVNNQVSGGADGPQGVGYDVDRLVQGVLLTRAIETLVCDVAGLANLLDMNLVFEPVHPGSDLAAAAATVGVLAGDAVRAIEELAAEIAGIHASVAAAGHPVRREPTGVSPRVALEIRAA